MKKSKLLLPVVLIVSLAIIISAVIVSLTAGINIGIDFVGGKQIEILLPTGSSTENYKNAVSEVLSEYDLSIDTSYTEDKFTESYYVVKINTREISNENALEIQEKIADKLSLPLESVSEVTTISGSVTQKTVLGVGFAILGLLVALFVAGWIRHGAIEGLTIIFGTLHTMIMSFAVLLVTRLQLTVSTVSAMFVLSVVFAGLYAAILERARETLNAKTNSLTANEAYTGAFNKLLVVILTVLVPVIILGVSSIFVASNMILMFAISSILFAIVTFYSLFVTTKLAGYLANVKITKQRHSLSKNK